MKKNWNQLGTHLQFLGELNTTLKSLTNERKKKSKIYEFVQVFFLIWKRKCGTFNIEQLKYMKRE